VSQTLSTSAREIFVVLWVALFAAMLGVGIMSPLLPTYATTLGASGMVLGFIFGGFSMARMIAMPVVGRLSDRSGRKRFISMGLAIQALAALAFIACETPLQLMAARMFQGLAGAMVIPISMAYVGELSPPGRESYYMGWFTVALFAGFGTGPIVGGVIEDHLSFTANFIVLGALNFIAFLGVIIFLPETGQTGQNRKSRTEIAYRVLLRNTVLRGMFIFRIANSFGRGVIAAFLPLLGEHVFGLTTTQVGIVLSANLLATSFFQPLFGHLADRIGRPGMMVVGTLIQSACMVLMPLAGSFWNLLAINLFMGLAGAIAIPAATGLIAVEGKKGAMGGSMALFNLGMSIGLASGPIVAGLLTDMIGYRGSFYFGAFAVFLGIVPLIGIARHLQRNNDYNKGEQGSEEIE